MQIYINYDGVINHLDILSKESQKCSQLITSLRLFLNEIGTENSDQVLRVKRIIRQAEKFHESISRRRDMLMEIVTILKKANIKTDVIISDLEQIIKKADDGGLDG